MGAFKELYIQYFLDENGEERSLSLDFVNITERISEEDQSIQMSFHRMEQLKQKGRGEEYGASSVL